MKKGYLISIIGIILFIILLLIGINIYDKSKTKLDTLENETNTTNMPENDLKANIVLVTTNGSEEKTSPNCLLIFKTYFEKCEHITVQNVEIPDELVNKTREEIEKFYNGWRIVTYNNLQIVLYREENGICNEHYMLKEKDGYIAIYSIDENENTSLKEVTSIITTYLPQEDKELLKEGIKVDGKEKLNQALEDYE
jgi:hypothetical protein